MYPDLSYFFHDIFGTPPDNALSIVKTFGFFLAIAFLVSAYILYIELRRKEKEGLLSSREVKIERGKAPTLTDILINALIGYIIGFKLVYIINNFAEFQSDAAGVLLSAKGVVWGGLLGALVLAAYKYWNGQRRKLEKSVVEKVNVYPHQKVGDITIVAAISGIIGAKIFALFESAENFQAFLSDPAGQLISGSGLAIYGGLIVAFITVFFYIRRLGIPPIHVMDAVAPALIIGYGVGRLGCHFSGDGDWGIVNTLAKPGWFVLPDWAWAYDYPRNVLRHGVAMEDCVGIYCTRLQEPVYPTPLWETIFALGIGGILWFLRKRLAIPGMLFFIYLIFNGIERFYIEKIRVNPDIDILGISGTQAEFISFLLIIAGVAGCIFLWLKKKGAKEP